jgi:hypothetical protein
MDMKMKILTRKIRTTHSAATVVIAALLGTGAMCAVQSQEPPPPANHWFDWDQVDSYKPFMLRKCGATPAIYEEFNQTAHKVAQAWGEAPGATGPDEYAQFSWMPSGCHLGSFKGVIEYWPWPRSDFRMEAVPGQPGKARPHITGETLYMSLSINTPAGITRIPVMNPNESAEVGITHVSRRIGGFPVYNDDHVLVIEAKGRSLFEPVSLGEALQRWIQYSYSGEHSLERHKALLAQLSPEELKKPAYLERDTTNGVIVTAPNDKTDPIVRYSRSYFDKSLSPATAQLLTLDIHFLDWHYRLDDPSHDGNRYSYNMTLNPDWSKIATLLR